MAAAAVNVIDSRHPAVCKTLGIHAAKCLVFVCNLLGFYLTKHNWGSYRIIDMAPGVLTASLAVKAGCRFSYHSHALRNETWVITKGEGTVILDGRERNVKAGDTVVIPSGIKHTLKAETGVTVIEVQSGSEIAADDKQMAEE